MKSLLPILLILPILVSASATDAFAQTNYRVTVPGANPESIQIRAQFTLSSDVIGMYITSSPQLESGQAELVRDLDIRDEQGAAIAWENAGSGDWKLTGTTVGQQLTLQYSILLDHGLYDWGPGIDEVAYRTDDGIFTTGASMFIVPGREMSDIEIDFELPDGWRASTPWPSLNDGRYRANDTMSLVRNC
jgi:hypothetical protein